MPFSDCNYCGCTFAWSWTEAFEKFGFMDGDGNVETWTVEMVLSEAGYKVKVEEWGMHNTVITSIMKNGVEQIPYDNPDYTFGYDDPHQHFPPDITRLLDEKLPDI